MARGELLEARAKTIFLNFATDSQGVIDVVTGVGGVQAGEESPAPLGCRKREILAGWTNRNPDLSELLILSGKQLGERGATLRCECGKLFFQIGFGRHSEMRTVRSDNYTRASIAEP